MQSFLAYSPTYLTINPDMSTLTWLGVAILAGVSSHLTFFVRGEWDGHSSSIPRFHGIAEVAILVYLWVTQDLRFGYILARFFLLNTGYFLGLFGSIALYRVFFHPLRKFPGPLEARLSAIWSSYTAMRNFRFPIKVQELHGKYGDFVRIRPREISIIDPAAIRDIHGPGSPCSRGPFYDIYYPTQSLLMTRDKTYHSQRRKVWDRGFSTVALSQYQSRIIRHCQDLITQISVRAGTPINASQWMSYFGFDVMGDLSFGKSFHMLKTGENSYILDLFLKGQPAIGVMQYAPWLYVIFLRLPFVVKKRKEFINWCSKQVKERKELGQSRKDLFTYILGDGDEETKAQPLSDAELVREAHLAIVAGSDTTSTTLAALLYLLAKYPGEQKRLQNEIDSLIELSGGDEIPYQMLVTKAPILNGCINEALRLYPPAFGNLPRITPPSGMNVAGKWIPGNTVVTTPMYSLHRDSRNFSSPDSFIPDRWSALPELILRKEAFIPFLSGTYGCAGRSLALMEIRMAVSAIVSSFSFKFPTDAGEDIYDLFDSENGLSDFFTAHAPDFNLVFSHRSKDE